MKKIFLVSLIGLLLTGCTSVNEAAKGEVVEQETSKIETIVGQVKNIVGNEITLSLGNLILENNQGDEVMMMVDENGNQIEVEKDFDINNADQVIMIPAPDDDMESTGTSDIKKMPIAFTGEVQEYTIMTGVKIVNALGKEVNIDAITNGSLIQMIVNQTTGDIESIMIW